ncbi:TRAP-type C4-dicarboxylate transport system, large permease component [Desulforapulum autotrophicum HRM2]|uniref:TRAP-type C4-dicarboxylate transport system, large permease component n=1 Tax=Desulforapulum autotrophicum (strain ATCC 43914 / DSM 3382 / VKM B-1955 / HRM2) TaxID=177437 RepID=C0QM86_DESAH|nr:TRAP transporter large permease subunit [Desulforapulum autotrophicum]ACN16403.1 TRAP-type C4-dicarboxylate transport system, large permease component [Desulforapulum autotrophicum HRM2]
MTNLIPIAIITLLAVFGAPLFAVILAAACAGFYFTGIDLSAIAIELYRLTDTPVMSALPLFTVAGYLLGESNTSKRLVRLSSAFLGWMPGGLAVVSFVTCALFTAFTGASGVTIVAVGALLLPALTRARYSEKFSLGLVTTSGSLGLLLPPSLPLILYGIVAQQMGSNVEIEDLFLAGILPALLMIVLLSLWSVWATRDRVVPLQSFSWKEALAAIKAAAWEIPLPIFLVAGIYGGFFAVSEAAAVVALYVIIVEVFVYREIPIARLPGILKDAMVMVGGILLILGVSLAFTNFLVDAGVPTGLFTLIQGHIAGKFTFLILLNLILLALGAILDIFSAIVIMVPLLLPIAESYGINPVHLGIIFLANMQIGYFTPPVGMNLFIASYRFEKPVTEIYASALPFMFVMILALLIITYVPALSLLFLS